MQGMTFPEIVNNVVAYLKLLCTPDKSMDDEYFFQTIKDNRLQNVIKDESRLKSKKMLGEMKNSSSEQRFRNELIHEEIMNIEKKTRKREIKLVHMKGLTLAYELYPRVEDRIYKDIDFIVSEKHLNDVRQILSASGYVECRDDPSSHHISFLKETVKKKKAHRIRIDAHYRVEGDYIDITAQDILARAVVSNFYSQKILIPELHDNLIFLLIHFGRHYKNDLLDAIYIKMDRVSARLSQLLDIALLINKRSGELNWQLLYERISRWKLTNEVLLVIQVIIRIFPNIVPSQFVGLLQNSFESERPTFGYDIFTRIISTEATEINLFCRNQKRKSIVSFMRTTQTRKEVNCQFATDGKVNSINSFSISEYDDDNRKKPDTHVSTGIAPSSNDDCSMTGSLFWDYEYFRVKLLVRDDVLIFHNELITADWWNKDALELFFINVNGHGSTPILTKIIIIPQKIGARLRISVFDQFGRFLDENDYQYRICLTEGGFNLDLQIPWDFITIAPAHGETIPFDISIIDCDDSTIGQKSKLSLFSGGYEPNWDILNFGRLRLL